MGNVLSMTDGLGAVTGYAYSLTGKLVKVTDPLGNETEYTYDDRDHLAEIRQYGEFAEAEENNLERTAETQTEAKGLDADLTAVQSQNERNRQCQVTRYERDLLGQITTITDALGNREQYKYDQAGQLLSKLDKEGYLTRYGYTTQGDVSHIQYADGRQVSFRYNALRQLQQMEDWLGITRIENDALGWAEKVTYPDGKEVSYSYKAGGRRTGITYPDGTTVSYGYDTL